MPVDWNRYPKNWKSKIRPAILKRENHCCKFCGAQNYKPHPITGSKVILTIAHLGHPYSQNADKHNKMDIRAENLAALCQRCHLRHDIDEHIENRRKKREKERLKNEPTLFPI